MSKRQPTQSEFVAKLIIEGSLDRLAGKAEGKFEVEGKEMGELEAEGIR